MDRDVAVVIGAGGMGLAIARRVGSGRKLLLADVRENALDMAAEQLRAEGQDITTETVDVSERASVASLADVAAGLGRVSHLAHTAGLSPEQASTEAILRVDLLGVALVLDEFARVVASGGAGVVIASMAGHMPGVPAGHEKALAMTPAEELLALPFLAPELVGDPTSAYALAKRANVLRVQAAASPWGDRGARVNSVSPGVVSTPMGRQELDGKSGEHIRSMVGMSPAKRVGTPDDVAIAAGFLLDPQTSFITGTDLLTDGGSVAAVSKQLFMA